MTESSPKLKQKFEGLVLLKEWLKLGDGKNYGGVHGYCTVMTAMEARGFVPNDKEANWLVLVENTPEPEEGTKAIVVLGCQIRGFQTGIQYYSLDKDFYRMTES